VGINTGEVVMRTVETGGRVEYTPVGHVANLAARLQGVAPAGGIVISEERAVWSRATSNCMGWATRQRSQRAAQRLRGGGHRGVAGPFRTGSAR
jgi:class 3 adenylate cyclase